MSEFNSDPSGEQHDELLAELDALLEHPSASQVMSLEQRQMLKKYVVEHEGEIEWIREQCRKLQDGSLSPADAQKWFEAFVAMEGGETA